MVYMYLLGFLFGFCGNLGFFMILNLVGSFCVIFVYVLCILEFIKKNGGSYLVYEIKN